MLRFFSGTLVLLVFAEECHSAPASGPVAVKKSPVALSILGESRFFGILRIYER